MGQLASTLPSEQATNAGKQDASWASSVKFCEYELLARNISKGDARLPVNCSFG